MLYPELLQKYPIISDQVDKTELGVILRELEKVLHESVEGDVVEFGCYTGTTSLFLQRLLSKLAPKKKLHVYDSFEGLPDKTAQDKSPAGEQFKAGELLASKKDFIQNFKKAGLPMPIVHKGWFNQLTQQDVPNKICLAFLDGDYYESIADSLKLVWPQLTEGAVVIVDDYQSEALPGPQKAVTAWLSHHRADLKIESSLAILRSLTPLVS